MSCKNTLLTCMRKRQPPMRSAPQDNGADGVGNDKNSKGHHVSAPPPPPPQSVVLAPASEGGDASSSAAAEPLPPVPAGFFALDPAACSRPHGARLASTTSSACGERLSVAGRPVAVFAVRGELFAIDAECPHQGASLEVGDIEESPRVGRASRALATAGRLSSRPGTARTLTTWDYAPTRCEPCATARSASARNRSDTEEYNVRTIV